MNVKQVFNSLRGGQPLTTNEWNRLVDEYSLEALVNMTPFIQADERSNVAELCDRRHSIKCTDDYFEPSKPFGYQQCHVSRKFRC